MKFRWALPISTLALFILSASFAVDIPDVNFKTKTAGKVIFSHKFHIRQKGLKDNCKSCHKAIFDLKKKVTHTMADMEKGKSCGACHDGKKAFGIGECVKCHKIGDVAIKVRETGPVSFRHGKHSAITDCRQCHPRLYEAGPNKRTTMAQMEKGKSCGACHTGKDAFGVGECAKCHPVKEIEFTVKDTGNVKFSHDAHLAMYQCGECHDKFYLPSPGNKRISMADMEKGKSCGACHDGGTAFTVKENCDKCHKM